MLKSIWSTIKLLAASRKVMLAFVSALVFVVGKVGWNVDSTTLIPIVAPIWAVIFGIAYEDGKAKEAGMRPKLVPPT